MWRVVESEGVTISNKCEYLYQASLRLIALTSTELTKYQAHYEYFGRLLGTNVA